jgi:metal-responsive CopG/Arc/MetJ family transcriptional regulator
MSKKDFELLHIRLPKKLLRMIDVERQKYLRTRTEIIREWLWGKCLAAPKTREDER